MMQLTFILQLSCTACLEKTLEPMLKLDPYKRAVHVTLSPLDQQWQCIDMINLLLFD